MPTLRLLLAFDVSELSQGSVDEKGWRGQIKICFPSLDALSGQQGRRLGRGSVLTPRARPRNAQAFFWALVFAPGLGCFQDCDANTTAQNAFPDPPGRSRLPRPRLLSILCIFYSTYENCFMHLPVSSIHLILLNI